MSFSAAHVVSIFSTFIILSGFVRVSHEVRSILEFSGAIEVFLCLGLRGSHIHPKRMPVAHDEMKASTQMNLGLPSPRRGGYGRHQSFTNFSPASKVSNPSALSSTPLLQVCLLVGVQGSRPLQYCCVSLLAVLACGRGARCHPSTTPNPAHDWCCARELTAA